MNAVLALMMMLLPIAQDAQQDEAVKFEVKSGIVWVEANINGEGPFKFMFDTGASITVLKPGTAKKLGLVDREPGIFSFLNPTIVKTRVQLGKAVADDVVCAVMVVPQADIPLWLTGQTYDGILGYTFISQFEITMNYKKGEMKLAPSGYRPQLDPAILQRLKEPAEKPALPPRVGLSFRTIGPDEANEVGVEWGVVVEAVAKDEPADKAGVKKGDIILEANGKRIRTAEDFKKMLGGLKRGETLKLHGLRDKKDIDVEVKLPK